MPQSPMVGRLLCPTHLTLLQTSWFKDNSRVENSLRLRCNEMRLTNSPAHSWSSFVLGSDHGLVGPSDTYRARMESGPAER